MSYVLSDVVLQDKRYITTKSATTYTTSMKIEEQRLHGF